MGLADRCSHGFDVCLACHVGSHKPWKWRVYKSKHNDMWIVESPPNKLQPSNGRTIYQFSTWRNALNWCFYAMRYSITR